MDRPRLRTVANRGARAIAGLSQGGFCAMSYAARHPDLFGVALSFSGTPDTAFDPVARELTTGAVTNAETALDRVTIHSGSGPDFGLQQALHSGLRIRVPLGPSNTVQQYGPASITVVFRSRVQIARDR